MSNDNKTNLKADHKANNRKQVGKISLLTEFVIFMALVAGIGLLLSLIVCQPAQASLLGSQLNIINEPLAMTGYGKEVAQ